MLVGTLHYRDAVREVPQLFLGQFFIQGRMAREIRSC